jgi:hypothetical protein
MKKIIFFFSLLAISTVAFSQKEKKMAAPQLPIDSSTKLITYEEVVQLGSEPAIEIYNRALSWFRTYFKNPGEVIRENDAQGHKVVGKHRFKIFNQPDKEGTKTEAGYTQYTISVAAKDGRYKYEITGFNWKQPSHYPAEKWMDKSAQYYTPAFDGYLQQLDEYTRALIANLKESMASTQPLKDKDKW